MKSTSYKDINEIEGEIFRARWIAIAGGALLVLINPLTRDPLFGWAVVSVGALYNAVVGYLLSRRGYHLVLSYVTSFLDAVFISLYIFFISDLTTEYIALYLLSIISVAIRFDLAETVFIGAVDCILYGIILSIHPYPRDFGLQFLIHCALIMLAALLLGYFTRQMRRRQWEGDFREKYLERKITELSVLQEVNRAVHDLHSNDTLRDIVEVATKVLGFNRASLLLANGEGDGVDERFFSVRDIGNALDSASRSWRVPPIRLDDELFAAILKKNRPIVVDGSQGSEAIGKGPEPLLAIPLRGVEGSIGVLVVDYDDTQPLAETDLDMLLDLASSAILAIENIQLHSRVQRMANRDGLTDLYNHRYFQESLRQELSRAQESARPVSLMMVEVDKFKDYNDKYGHQRGDLALKSIARALERGARRWGGLVARYGGDEFVVLLPGLDKAESLKVAQEIHKKIVTYTAKDLGRYSLPRVSISLGVATSPVDAEGASDLIDAADLAMYTAKRRGGDRVHSFDVSSERFSVFRS